MRYLRIEILLYLYKVSSLVRKWRGRTQDKLTSHRITIVTLARRAYRHVSEPAYRFSSSTCRALACQGKATGFLRMRKTQRELAERNEVEMTSFSTDQVSS